VISWTLSGLDINGKPKQGLISFNIHSKEALFTELFISLSEASSLPDISPPSQHNMSLFFQDNVAIENDIISWKSENIPQSVINSSNSLSIVSGIHI
jgi:hypothetical protein